MPSRDIRKCLTVDFSAVPVIWHSCWTLHLVETHVVSWALNSPKPLLIPLPCQTSLPPTHPFSNSPSPSVVMTSLKGAYEINRLSTHLIISLCRHFKMGKCVFFFSFLFSFLYAAIFIADGVVPATSCNCVRVPVVVAFSFIR